MKSLEELAKIRESAQARVILRKESDANTRILVGMATCGIAAGARPVLSAIAEDVSRRNLQDVTVSQTGCIGVCRLEPIVEVYRAGEEKVTYVRMTPEKAARVISEHIVNHNVVAEYTIGAAE